ncbi:unnamed protein product, partial [Amoebophrya sp. A120]|eukprot:GSA120T00011679001.1
MLKAGDADKLEKFEHTFHKGFGNRHKSIRKLTGRTGDRFRQLDVVDKFHESKRRVLRRQLQGGVHSTPLGYYNLGTPVPAGVVAMPSPAATGAPASPPPSYVHGLATAWQAQTSSPKPVPLSTDATTPMPLASPLAGNRTTPVTIHSVMDQQMFDGSDGTFKPIFYMDSHPRPHVPMNTSADPFNTEICVTYEANSATHAPVTECMNAMPWEPDVMGYHPSLVDDHHAGTVHCPTDNGYADTSYAASMANMPEGATNFMQNTPEGYACFEGMVMPDFAIKEHEEEMSGRHTTGEVLHEVCHEAPNPFGPDLMMELENFAYEHFTEVCYCPEKCPETACGGFPTIADQMLHQLQLAFSEPGHFNEMEVREPRLLAHLHHLQTRLSTSPGVQDRAHAAVTAEKYGGHSLAEAITFGIASGDIMPMIAKAEDKGGDVFDQIKRYASRDPTSPSLTFGEIKSYYEDCMKSQRPPGVAVEVCELLDKVKDIMMQKMSPNSDIPMSATVSRTEMMLAVAQVEPGHEPGMPMGESMAAGDYMCSQLMHGGSGCVTADCMEHAFFEQSRGAATVPKDALYLPGTEAQAIRAERAPMLDIEKREHQERMD